MQIDFKDFEGFFSWILRRNPVTPILGGAGLIALAVWAWIDSGGVAFAVGIAAGLGLAGVFLIAHGIRLAVTPKLEEDRPDVGPSLEVGRLVVAMETADRPFYVCTDCRLIFAAGECHGMCLRCDSVASCLKIDSDEDLALARAALG